MVLIAAYEQYRLWYVTSDLIAFAGPLDIVMSVVLGLRGNVREVLEMIYVIE